MVVVDDLNERLDTSASQDLAASHGLGNRAGAAVDSNYDSVGEGTSLGGVLDRLNDDGLASGELTLGEDDNLTCLEELHAVFLGNRTHNQINAKCGSQVSSQSLEYTEIVPAFLLRFSPSFDDYAAYFLSCAFNNAIHA